MKISFLSAISKKTARIPHKDKGIGMVVFLFIKNEKLVQMLEFREICWHLSQKKFVSSLTILYFSTKRVHNIYVSKKVLSILTKERGNRLEYAIGAVVGLIFGGLVGQLKNLFIWRKYLRDSDSSGAAEQNSVGGLYARAGISYFVNILTLAAAFFLRNAVPFHGLAFLVGTAVALTIMNKVLALGHKRFEDRQKEA